MTENTENAAETADPAAEIAALQARLAETEQRLSALKEQGLRAAAEAENVRKRSERELATSLKYAAERVLADLLAITDSLELGLKAAEAPQASTSTIREGVALTHKQLHAFFEKHGVKVLDPAGEPFNPELHEAVSMLESPDVAPNHVLSVMQKGYRLHERLLRPAMVVVARAPNNRPDPAAAS
ncbi:MAG: nucleotide exchange factor GrpE [Nevskia sp.]|nr:nucleotide exchange factor GrpE [Nevskia sp.]